MATLTTQELVKLLARGPVGRIVIDSAALALLTGAGGKVTPDMLEHVGQGLDCQFRIKLPGGSVIQFNLGNAILEVLTRDRDAQPWAIDLEVLGDFERFTERVGAVVDLRVAVVLPALRMALGEISGQEASDELAKIARERKASRVRFAFRDPGQDAPAEGDGQTPGSPQ